MPFKDYIYLDSDAVERYSNQLSRKQGKPKLKLNKVTSSFKAGLGPASATVGLDADITDSALDAFSMLEQFEQSLIACSGGEFLMQ